MKRSNAGRKPLASTVWLAERLCQGAYAAALYDEWHERHREIMGYDCKDAPRSFRAALRNAYALQDRIAA